MAQDRLAQNHLAQNDMTQNRDAPITLSDDEARQGVIILRKRWQRVVFIVGLVGVVAVLLIAHFLTGH
jgi:hypothetical protein